MNRAAIAIGSNIDPERSVPVAVSALARRHTLLGESALRKTSPIGPQDQPDFINGAVLIETEMGRRELQDWLKGVEARLGRQRGGDRYGPRTIDLDLVAWNGRIVDEDVHRRDFLQEALREVWPELEV